MSIANLWKRKDAKLRTLGVMNAMVAGCHELCNSIELPICLLFRSENWQFFFYV